MFAECNRPSSTSARSRSMIRDPLRSTRTQRHTGTRATLVLFTALFAAVVGFRRGSAVEKLRLEEVGADSTAFHVVSTLIVGPTEVLLWDAQYHAADAERVADRIASTGKRLKAVIISHPD